MYILACAPVLSWAQTFGDRAELKEAVDACVVDNTGCAAMPQWDVSAVRDFSYLFYSCSDLFFDQDLSGWEVASATNMEGMFFGARHFNQNLSSWNVSGVENAEYMFYGASNFNQTLCDAWGGLSDFNEMFTESQGVKCCGGSFECPGECVDGECPSGILGLSLGMAFALGGGVVATVAVAGKPTLSAFAGLGSGVFAMREKIQYQRITKRN